MSVVIKQLYRVERRGYKNLVVNVIDGNKVFVRSIGNFQEYLNVIVVRRYVENVHSDRDCCF